MPPTPLSRRTICGSAASSGGLWVTTTTFAPVGCASPQPSVMSNRWRPAISAPALPSRSSSVLALAASIYLATIGPHGLRDVAATGAARAAELEAALADHGIRRLHPGPYLNEFAIAVPDARAVHRRLLDQGFLAGLALADAEPDDETLRDALLVCATEVTTSAEIAAFAAALGAAITPLAAAETAGAVR